MDFTVKFKMDLTVTVQDIDDIMCAALEGGITYWCCAANVVGDYLGEYPHEQISRGGELELHDAESDDKWVLTRDMLLSGIKQWAEWGGEPVTCLAICDNGTLDTSEIDAEIADMIVQYAVFGEVVFG